MRAIDFSELFDIHDAKHWCQGLINQINDLCLQSFNIAIFLIRFAGISKLILLLRMRTIHFPQIFLCEFWILCLAFFTDKVCFFHQQNCKDSFFKNYWCICLFLKHMNQIIVLNLKFWILVIFRAALAYQARPSCPYCLTAS